MPAGLEGDRYEGCRYCVNGGVFALRNWGGVCIVYKTRNDVNA